MLDNNVENQKFTDDNNKQLESSENNNSQDLSKTNFSENNAQINPEQEKIENDDNHKKSLSSEDNGDQDLSKINSDEKNEEFKELQLSKNNNFQDLSQTNVSGNNEQINPEQQKIENDVNCDITLSKVFELITELQKSLTVQIKEVQEQIQDIQDKQEWIIQQIDKLSNDVKNPLPNIQPKTRYTKSRSNKYEPPMIPVECLQKHGKDKLHKELEIMTDDELKQMNKHLLSKPKKELDKIDRKQMIQNLIKYAETELNRGGKFEEDR
ncbi:hypothetical protein IQ227_15600 [Anabaena aphanizomenioides LEGE 00250]|jgi:hypothetical protein|uniref:Uncharacterized protein n=1 Tax=Sphaerospermopsis aphanizomenoides LEGE 00250 TaxID=2777972 RepID=A0ABR9VFY4_9CYAN|nr:hypothetical protein [Sphaerospermopsis aphanizomenoides]MBE9237413.1 hypothetical protein [Sphaerospermopsis aphanizomenoides LEGE 00250]